MKIYSWRGKSGKFEIFKEKSEKFEIFEKKSDDLKLTRKIAENFSYCKMKDFEIAIQKNNNNLTLLFINAIKNI